TACPLPARALGSALHSAWLGALLTARRFRSAPIPTTCRSEKADTRMIDENTPAFLRRNPADSLNNLRRGGTSALSAHQRPPGCASPFTRVRVSNVSKGDARTTSEISKKIRAAISVGTGRTRGNGVRKCRTLKHASRRLVLSTPRHAP